MGKAIVRNTVRCVAASRVCPDDTIRCGLGGRCVPRARACDGTPDCDDAADEAGCDCPPQHMRCDAGACVPLAARCDAVRDCADGSDERDCPACINGNCTPVTGINYRFISFRTALCSRDRTTNIY